MPTTAYTAEQLRYDPRRWYDLPGPFRNIEVDPKWEARIKGVELTYFVKELQTFVTVDLTIAQAVQVLFFRGPSNDIRIIWNDSDVRSFSKSWMMNSNGAVRIGLGAYGDGCLIQMEAYRREIPLL